MGEFIKIKVRKELEGPTQQHIIRLKGSLIARGYTQIIHIEDLDEQFHLNSFEAEKHKGSEARQFIEAFIASEGISGIVSIC